MENSFYAYIEENKKKEIAFAEILLPFDLDGSCRYLKYIYKDSAEQSKRLSWWSIKILLKSLGFLFSASFRVCLRVFIVGITLSNIDLE